MAPFDAEHQIVERSNEANEATLEITSAGGVDIGSMAFRRVGEVWLLHNW